MKDNTTIINVGYVISFWHFLTLEKMGIDLEEEGTKNINCLIEQLEGESLERRT